MNIVQEVAVVLGLQEITVRSVLFERRTAPKVPEEIAASIRECAASFDWEPRSYPDLEPAPLDERNTLSDTLRHTLGDDGYFLLVEAYAGCRVYIPANINLSELPEVISVQHAATLAAYFGGRFIRVPMAREFRLMYYIKLGMTNRQIAIRLALAEASVDRKMRRLRERHGPLR